MIIGSFAAETLQHPRSSQAFPIRGAETPIVIPPGCPQQTAVQPLPQAVRCVQIPPANTGSAPASRTRINATNWANLFIRRS